MKPVIAVTVAILVTPFITLSEAQEGPPATQSTLKTSKQTKLKRKIRVRTVPPEDQEQAKAPGQGRLDPSSGSAVGIGIEIPISGKSK